MAVKTLGVLWLTSICVRFLWTIYPQTGYIHPDEFFQSPEIISGDVLGVYSLRTWEFNSSFPLRSVVFPYLTAGFPFWILRHFTNGRGEFDSRTLLILPRLSFCLFSLAVDFCGYRIAEVLHIDPLPVLTLIGTSYTSLVFLTRPFSNSTESALFALLLWFVIAVIASTWTTSGQNEGSKMARLFFIGVIIASGFWNRPTFVGFGLIPVLSLLAALSLRHTALNASSFVVIILKDILFIAVGFLAAALIFVTIDSFYFSEAYFRITITPLNFLRYNLDSLKVEEHGIHPRFTHFLVNFPLLCGILFVFLCAFLVTFAMQRDFVKTLETFQISRDTMKMVKHASVKFILVTLLLSALVPVSLLSVIPHQEPRFILPVLLPLAILFSHLIFGKKAYWIATASWIIWNILGAVVFGVLHQGGVTQCLVYLQQQMHAKDGTYHIIFSNTYMPPRHLLAWSSHDNSNQQVLSRKPGLNVYDLAGQPITEINAKLTGILKVENKENAKRMTILLVAPSKIQFHHKDFTLIKQFYPHLSMEHPPNVMAAFVQENLERCHHGSTLKSHLGQKVDQPYCVNKRETLSNWFKQEFALNLYKYTSEFLL